LGLESLYRADAANERIQILSDGSEWAQILSYARDPAEFN
jgi:hypothetical protein